LLSGQVSADRASPATGEYVRSEASEEPARPSHSRATRAAARNAGDGWTKGRNHIEDYNSVDEMDDEDEALSSENEWDSAANDDRMGVDDSASEDATDDDLEGVGFKPQGSLLVVLKYGQGRAFASTKEAKSEDVVKDRILPKMEDIQPDEVEMRPVPREPQLPQHADTESNRHAIPISSLMSEPVAQNQHAPSPSTAIEQRGAASSPLQNGHSINDPSPGLPSNSFTHPIPSLKTTTHISPMAQIPLPLQATAQYHGTQSTASPKPSTGSLPVPSPSSLQNLLNRTPTPDSHGPTLPPLSKAVDMEIPVDATFAGPSSQQPLPPATHALLPPFQYKPAQPDTPPSSL
jgi:hypothetical protein